MQLGRGFSFPLRLDDTGTRPSFSENERSVFESIEALINTNVGERPHLVKNGVPYGTRFRALLFTNVDAAMDLAQFDVRRALDTWEPRIFVTNVDMHKQRDRNSGMTGIYVNIAFRYRTSGRVDNYVKRYPAEGGM